MNRRILVFGGTHGNEWTGVTTILHYAESLKKKHPALDLHFILANPEAHKINRRFKDEDLNRAFQFLHEERSHSYEHRRAQELKTLITERPCFVIDLHTTTSNMGTTLILTHLNGPNLHLAGRLMHHDPECRTIISPDPHRKYLGSQSDHGVMIEVGPIANGLVGFKILESTLRTLDTLLTELALLPPNPSGSVEVYEEIQDVHYPLDKQGQIDACIHPALQDRDFIPLKGPYEAFKSFDGRTVTMETKEELYPIFINEAAYYPAKLAFTLCRKSLLRY